MSATNDRAVAKAPSCQLLRLRKELRKLQPGPNKLRAYCTTGTETLPLLSSFISCQCLETGQGRNEGFNHPCCRILIYTTYPCSQKMFFFPNWTVSPLVSNYTKGEVCDLRPCEVLGIRIDLVADYCDPNGDYTTMW